MMKRRSRRVDGAEKTPSISGASSKSNCEKLHLQIFNVSDAITRYNGGFKRHPLRFNFSTTFDCYLGILN